MSCRVVWCHVAVPRAHGQHYDVGATGRLSDAAFMALHATLVSLGYVNIAADGASCLRAVVGDRVGHW